MVSLRALVLVCDWILLRTFLQLGKGHLTHADVTMTTRLLRLEEIDADLSLDVLTSGEVRRQHIKYVPGVASVAWLLDL